jgi:diguanylate cyclase (GGDEF)-like protein/putative nucleotidyltransferase with HDIG domain
MGAFSLILIPLISFLCYSVILIIILGSRKNKITLSYALYVIAMIVWSFGSFIMRTNLPPGTIFWNRILCIGLISMPVVFYHFTLSLTRSTNQKGKLYFGYLSAGILLISNFAGLITKDAYTQNNVFYYSLGPMASVMAIWSIGYLVLSFINIVDNVKSNKIPYARVKYILFGLILVIIGGLLNLLPSLGKYPLDIASNTINALFIAYSIYKYRFLEIKLIVKRGIAYSIYTLLLTGLYIIAIFGVQQILSNLMGYTNMTTTLIMACLLAIVLQPIKNWMQHWIDRIFYKENLNHQEILRDFSQVINNILNLDELTDSLLDAIRSGLQPQNISLYLRQRNDKYNLYRTSIQEKWCQENVYSKDHPIVQWFLQGKSMLTIEEIDRLPFFTGLWSEEKKQLNMLDTEIIVPIKIREQLIGILILSEKKGGEVYSQEEMNLLMTLVNNAAIVIENAKMYEEAKYQAITDGLTKLYNHRHFHEVLGQIIQEKSYEVFSVAMIDVDLFKLYNDLYGHSAGDKALAKIAKVIKKATRKDDFIARYGGEEFAIIFPNIEGIESYKAIEAIRKAVESSFLSNETNEFITISIGVANYPSDGKTAEEILERADAAMYVAKRSGRNQSILYSKKDEVYYSINNHKEVEKMQNSIQSAYFSAIYALAATIDAKDHYTYGHSESVSSYAAALARAAGLAEEKVDVVKNAGLLHDIGKIGIPENILAKTSVLSFEEYETMKRHVDISVSIIKHIPSLIKVIPAIMSHHERYDGKGYPRGIKGENIPLEGRCLSIVDAFDAMITDRPYRKALSVEDAIAELKKCSGTQFDPRLTEIFINLYKEGEINVA